MKEAAATTQATETTWQRLDRAFRTVLKVSKEDFVKADQERQATKPAKNGVRKKRP